MKTQSEGTVLDSGKPVSRSIIWELQEQYYSSRSEQAWAEGIPFQITNGVPIADTYAALVLAFLRDNRTHLDPDAPLYLIEIGSGLGRFGHHFVRELARKFRYFPETRELKWKVVLTDFSPGPVQFWSQHPKLAPLVEAGYLDFARFRPDSDQQVALEKSGEILTSSKLKNPLVVIANYFFDSIAHDQFRIKSKRVMECQLTVMLKEQKKFSDPDRVDIRDTVMVRNYEKVSPKSYYQDPLWNRVLEFYQQKLRRAEITIPVGAFQVWDNLSKLSNGKLLLLSSDKGFTKCEDLTQVKDHAPQIHAGAFSHAVNFDALGRYVRQRGGHYYHTDYGYLASLHTVACVALPDLSEEPLPTLHYTFQEQFERRSQLNSLNELRGVVRQQPQEVLRGFLAFMRLNLHDPFALGACAKEMTGMVAELSQEQRKHVIEAIEQTWDNFYWFPGAINVAFWMGHLFFHLGLPSRAATAFDHTMNFFGEDAILLYLKGQCLEQLNLPRQARDCYQKSLALEPNLRESIDALKDLDAR